MKLELALQNINRRQFRLINIYNLRLFNSSCNLPVGHQIFTDCHGAQNSSTQHKYSHSVQQYPLLCRFFLIRAVHFPGVSIRRPTYICSAGAGSENEGIEAPLKRQDSALIAYFWFSTITMPSLEIIHTKPNLYIILFP